MPLYRQSKCDGFILGIWKIQETPEFLCTLFPDPSPYIKIMEEFRSVKRQQERLSVRALCQSLLGRELFIEYYPTGRPFVVNAPLNISISHTKEYAAVLLSKNNKLVGVDIERISDKIDKLASRILGECETARNRFELLLHWCAKETAVKLLDKQGVDFCRHFRVEGLHPIEESGGRCNDSGTFQLYYFINDSCKGNFKMHYLIEEDFVLTYCVD